MTRLAKSELAPRSGAKRRTARRLSETATKSVGRGPGDRSSNGRRVDRDEKWKQKAEALTGELHELRRQQRATNEILRTISSSPTDLQGVLNAVANNAARLCDARDVFILRVAGDVVQIAAHSGKIPTEEMGTTFPILPGYAAGKAILTRQVVHVRDLAGKAGEAFPGTQSLQTPRGVRTLLVVPLLRDGVAIGAIAMRRREVRPFSARQIELVRTFADQAVIAIENTRLFGELETKNKALAEALEQQTATSEILRVISQSQTDVKPVFETIGASALNLCRAKSGAVYTFDGELIYLATVHGLSPEALEAARRAYPMRPGRGGATARAVLSRAVTYIPDVLEDPEFQIHSTVQAAEHRSIVSVPMLRDGNPIGAITVGGAQPSMFSERQIALLKTFADQAVIAIENVRLFKELEERNKSLTETLDQQIATSEILRVISSSPTDVQPVLDVIVESAATLCGSSDAAILRVDGDLLRQAAHFGSSFSKDDAVPVPIRADMVSGRAVIRRQTIYVSDLFSEAADEYAGAREFATWLGYRNILATPLLHENLAVGVIIVRRAEVTSFSDRQIEMLKTFADQAVIAIENTRLFKELEERLEQQTATSEILRVISQSQSDVQPVFETIAANARKLSGSTTGMVGIVDGTHIRFMAGDGVSPDGLETMKGAFFPRPIGRDSAAGRAVLSGRPAYIPDIGKDADYALKDVAEQVGYRSIVSVPMIHEGNALGNITVTGAEPAMFSERQIAMLQTFADQAVIAIENTRLFNELQARTQELAHSVEQLEALAEVSEAVNSTLDLQKMLETIVARAVQLSGASGGAVYEFDDTSSELHLRATHGIEPELVDLLLAKSVRYGEGASGRAAAERAPVEISDLRTSSGYTAALGNLIERMGIRAILALPLMREDRVLGTLTVSRRVEGTFAPEVVGLLQTYAAQSALAIQNARLFREIEQKGHELEIASQHKSQFLANMSHELRTPLNAILGYTELITDQIYGPVPDKILEVLDRVEKSGRHLLGLINDVLDLSKIEAGQLVLSLADYSFSDVVQAVASALGSLAAEKRLALEVDLAPDLPIGRGDERRITQVLLNLVGNAIKFTEAGRVTIRVTASDGSVLVAVTDTGPGIPEQDQQRIFEEFQQSDNSPTKTKSGTGLGLAIAMRIVEMHGGRIWVESTVGKGSTFLFSIPVRIEQQVAAP